MKNSKNLIIAIIAICFGFFSTQYALADNNDWANFGKYRDKNIEIMAKPKNSQRVVFMGDSITEFWDKDFFKNPNYVNRGISGQTTAQMLLRFRADVVALKPQIVVILAGTNDVAGNTGPATNEMIQDNIASMVEIAQSNNIKVIISSILPAADYYWAPDLKPAPRIVALNKWLKQYARINKITYLDYNSPMNDGNDGIKKAYSDDGVHPNQAGYVVMNQLAKAAIGKTIKKK
jgi:lysophospholipase L1-like esterase